MEPLTHKGTAQLETKRLVLRRFTVDDAEAMYRNWAFDPRVSEYMTWEAHPNAECTRALLPDWVAQYENANYYHWCIEHKDIGEAVGSIGVVGINEHSFNCELGYSLGHAFWGKGYMPEALLAVLRFLFAECDFYRVHARHDARNPKSGRVMEKCGMQYEGTLRGVHYYKNHFADCKQYAILRNEIQL